MYNKVASIKCTVCKSTRTCICECLVFVASIKQRNNVNSEVLKSVFHELSSCICHPSPAWLPAFVVCPSPTCLLSLTEQLRRGDRALDGCGWPSSCRDPRCQPGAKSLCPGSAHQVPGDRRFRGKGDHSQWSFLWPKQARDLPQTPLCRAGPGQYPAYPGASGCLSPIPAPSPRLWAVEG